MSEATRYVYIVTRFMGGSGPSSEIVDITFDRDRTGHIIAKDIPSWTFPVSYTVEAWLVTE